MKKNDLEKMNLMDEEIDRFINEHLPLSNGQECMIYKASGDWEDFKSDDIIYIPDIHLNDIQNFWYTGDVDYLNVVSLIENCYTKQDFIEIAEDRARELFNEVDWQHPETLLDEKLMEEAEEVL